MFWAGLEGLMLVMDFDEEFSDNLDVLAYYIQLLYLLAETIYYLF